MDVPGVRLVKGRLQVQAVVFVTVLVFAVGMLATGDKPNPAWLRFYSYAVTAAVVLVTAWDRWLWRLAISQKVAAVPRDLNGTWKGVLTTFWVDPETGAVPPPKPAFLVVRQTATTASITMFTDQMRSVSSLASLSSVEGQRSLDYMYLSRPDSRYEKHSRIHHGSTSLDVTGNPPDRLCGRYWTNRDSRGELDFTARRRGFADRYDTALCMFGGAASSKDPAGDPPEREGDVGS
jgi:hypothetical protein